MAIEIALASPDDAVGMQEVFYRAWLATYPNKEAGVTVDDIEDVFKDYLSPKTITRRRARLGNPPEGQTILVAKDGGKVVGHCRVIRREGENELATIYVLPEYQRQGVGTKLWQEAQPYINHAHETLVVVVTYNTRAIRFYGRLGFRDTGRRTKNPRFTMKSGTILEGMEMRRPADI